MSFIINTIKLDAFEIPDRTVSTAGEVQSIKVNQIDGRFLTCYPLLDDGTIVLYPSNPNNTSYSEVVLKAIEDYGSLDFPLDTAWNIFQNRFWIADAGNSSIVLLNSIDYSYIRSVEGFILPHSIQLNENDRSIFVKSFVDENTQKVTQVSTLGEILFEFEFPYESNSLEIEYTNSFIKSLPKTFTMDFDINNNRLWFVGGSILYMIDLDTKQITENDLKDGRLDNLSCVSVDRDSGNAFVIIDDIANHYIQQIYKDNNKLLGTAYLEEQPLP